MERGEWESKGNIYLEKGYGREGEKGENGGGGWNASLTVKVRANAGKLARRERGNDLRTGRNGRDGTLGSPRCTQ